MRAGWKFYTDYQAWNDARRLFIRFDSWGGEVKRGLVQPLVLAQVERGMVYDTPTLSETFEDSQDNTGDVTGFLQAALDAAWELGMRPTAYADHTNELKAVRYHLEDMRQLAKLPRKT